MSDSVISVYNTELIVSQKTSNATQKKWLKINRIIEEDFLGYEGLSKVVCSRIAAALDFSYGFTEYLPCRIYDETRHLIINACFSRVPETELTTVSLEKIMSETFGIDLSSYLDSVISTKEKAEYTVSRLSKINGLENVGKYLSDLFLFDWLVLNENRSFQNILFISDGDGFRFAPLSVSERTLLSDTTENFQADATLNACIKNAKAKPFNKSFKKQYEVFRNLYGNSFELRPVKIKISDLFGYYGTQEVSRVMKLLESQYTSLGFKGKIDFY